jgi:hypothetical protein
MSHLQDQLSEQNIKYKIFEQELSDKREGDQDQNYN